MCVCVCFVVLSDADWQSSKAVLVEASSRGETSRLIAADIQTLIIAGESPRRSLGYLYHVGGGDWMGLTTHIRYTHVDTERERKTSPDSKITSWTLMDTQRPPQFKDTSAQQRSNRRSKTKRARCISVITQPEKAEIFSYQSDRSFVSISVCFEGSHRNTLTSHDPPVSTFCFLHFTSSKLFITAELNEAFATIFWQNCSLRGRVHSFRISWRKKTHNSHFLFSFHFENICFKFTAQIVGNKSDCDVMSNICIKKARGIKGWLKVHRVVRVRLFPIFDFSCCQMQHLAAREGQNISFSVSVSH